MSFGGSLKTPFILINNYMSLTNFPGGITSMGMPVLGSGVPTTFGKVVFVDADNGSDGNDGSSLEAAVKTIAQAYSLVRTNRDDVIMLSTNAVHTISAMLDLSKSRVHFVSLDCFGRRYGQRAKMYMGVTTAVTDVFMIKNTGIGNTFSGIKFYNDNTLTQNVAAVGEGGEYAVYSNCEFYDSTRLTSDTHAEMVLNGDSAQFNNCTFGSLADAVTGDKVRPAILLTKETVGTGLVSRDVLFDGCRFWKQAGGTTTAMVKGAATDVERVMEFHDCQFVANPLGSTPAVAISSATLTVGMMILTGDTCAFNCTKIATATGVFSGLSAKVATATIGLQTT
jgi:hypothetical protein